MMAMGMVMLSTKNRTCEWEGSLLGPCSGEKGECDCHFSSRLSRDQCPEWTEHPRNHVGDLKAIGEGPGMCDLQSPYAALKS